MESTNSMSNVGYEREVAAALESLNQGLGSSEKNVVRRIMAEESRDVSQNIYDAIDQGVIDGVFVYPMGHDGPLAITDAVTPILSSVPNDYIDVDFLVRDIINEYPDVYPPEDTYTAENLITQLRIMVGLLYIEANDRLQIRIGRYLYNDRMGLDQSHDRRLQEQDQSQQSTLIRRRRVNSEEPAVVQTQQSISRRKGTTTAIVRSVHTKSRKPSPYNNYMANEIARIKRANPGLDHKDAFKEAAANWKRALENPKRE